MNTTLTNDQLRLYSHMMVTAATVLNHPSHLLFMTSTRTTEVLDTPTMVATVTAADRGRHLITNTAVLALASALLATNLDGVGEIIIDETNHAALLTLLDKAVGAGQVDPDLPIMTLDHIMNVIPDLDHADQQRVLGYLLMRACRLVVELCSITRLGYNPGAVIAELREENDFTSAHTGTIM